MELLFLPLSAMGAVFILAPVAAILPAAFFLWVFIKHKRKSALIAGLSWLVYLAYEYLMKLRILCSGECNIRIDLLLIYPFLLAVSLIAIIVVIKNYRSQRDI